MYIRLHFEHIVDMVAAAEVVDTVDSPAVASNNLELVAVASVGTS